MRIRSLSFAAVALATVALPAVAQAQNQPLDLYKARVNPQQLALLAQEGYDVTEARKANSNVVSIVATAGQARKLQAQKVPVALMRDKFGRTARQRARAAQAPDGTYDVYRPYGADAGRGRPNISTEMRQLAAANKKIAEVVTIGRTLRGQPILALKVTGKGKKGRGNRAREKPAILYSGTQHAREWIATEVTRRLMHWYVDGYGKNADATKLVDSRELWFVPVANPDGYDFTFTPGNRLWRKNLRDVNGDGQITTGDGVDPNRNYPTKWNYDDEGSSSNPASETYRGSGPASEPETQALDGLMKRERFVAQINYHSFAALLLYPVGWQVETPTIDDPLFVALSGDDAKPAIPGFDPDLSAELYTTNGETTDHAYTQYGTLAWTPELDGGADDGGFVFQDNEADVQAEFEKNLPFALDVAKSADDPADPESHLGNVAPDFKLHPFATSYGDPQTVQVDAKRELGPVALVYRVNGGRTRIAATREWQGGNRYGKDADVYYHRMRGEVTGTKPGDSVEVWFAAARGKRTEPFTYTVASDTGNPVLIMAGEDYTGPLPTQGGVGPKYSRAYEEALQANNIGYDVYDVDARNRTAPDPLGVLSHYRTVIWETGDDLLTREPDQGPGSGASKLADDEIIAVRDYMNEGGKLLFSGQNAGYGLWNAFPYNPAGQPPYCAPAGEVENCVSLSNDFLQYWLGAYVPIDVANDHDAVAAEQLLETGGPFGSARFQLNGPDSADNQEHMYSFVTTSSVLPRDQYPQFASDRAVALDRPSAFDPPTGSKYALARSDDASYKRLSKTFDLSGAASTADLSFKLSYDTEPGYDFVFVEAHTVGQDDWTTLPDANGNTSPDVGLSCDIDWNTLHPFLNHYQSNPTTAEDCTGTGTTGTWNGATGNSGGFQDWKVDLSAYKGKQVEVSITYATDFATLGLGAFLDDPTLTVDGAVADQTSFESGADGWTPGVAEGTESQATWEVPAASVGFIDGPGIATSQSLYWGFGLEGVRGVGARAQVLGDAMRYLGATGGRRR